MPIPPLPLPSLIPFLLFLPPPCMVSCCKSVCPQRTFANPFSFFSDTGCPLACRHPSPAHVPISRLAPRTPARPSWKTCIHFYLSISPPGSRLYTSSEISRLQCRIHIDRVSLGSYRAFCTFVRFCLLNRVYPYSFKAPRCTRSTQFLSKLGLGCVHAHRVPSPLDIRLSFFGHEIPYSYASVSSVRLDILKNKDLSLSVVGIQVVLSSFPSTYPPRFQLCHHIALQPLLLLPVYSLLGIPSHQGAGDVEHYARRTRGGSCHTNLI
jgi:hypothetical protein